MDSLITIVLFKLPYAPKVPTLPAKDDYNKLKLLGDSFDAATFDWNLTKPFGLLNRCAPEPRTGQPTCGKILAWAKDKVTSFRERMGIRVCVFKVGVTANPITRYHAYLDQGFTSMWVISVSPSLDLIHMLEAALVSEFNKHVGCRNKEGSGVEGALNKKQKTPPPYFLYVTGGRADQSRRVG